MSGRTLNPDEQALWRRVMATVKPLRAVAPVAAPPVPCSRAGGNPERKAAPAAAALPPAREHKE